MIFTIFWPASGAIEKTLDAPDIETLLLSTPDGADYIPGSYDPDAFWIDGHMMPQPLPPSPGPWCFAYQGNWIDPRTPADMQAALYGARDGASMDKTDLLTALLMAGALSLEDFETAGEGRIPSAIEPQMANLPIEAQAIARVKWRNDNVISRVNPVIVLAAQALGITDEQMDAIFGVTIP